MKAKKRILALVLLLVCAFTSACSPDSENATPLPSEAKLDRTDAEVRGEIIGYIKTPIEGLGDVESFLVYENKLYAYVDGALAIWDGAAVTELHRLDEMCYINSFDADANGLWLLEAVFDGVTPEAAYSIVLLDFAGNELFRSETRSAPDFDPEWGEPLEIKALDGQCYIRFTNNTVACLDRNTNSYTGYWSAPEPEAGESIDLYGLHKNKSGLFAELLIPGGDVITPIFPEDGELTPVPSEKIHMFDNPQQDALLCEQDAGLFLWEPGKEPKPAVIWAESNITNSFLTNVQPYGKGFVIQDESALYLLEQGVIRPKIVLTLAVLSALPRVTLDRAVHQFNQLSEDYFVEMENLIAAYGSLGDALNALNIRVIAGQGPDLIYFGGLSPIDYSSSGYLADIYELIDADPDLSRDDFLCLKAMETQGGLYTVTPGFRVNTFVGLSSVFGGRTGWTFDEYFAMEAQRSEDRPMILNISPEVFLEQSVVSYIPKAVDWENYTCDFDNGEFIAILEAAGRVKSADPSLEMEYITENPELILTKDINVIQPMFLDDPYRFAAMEDAAGQDLCFIGWPSPSGENTSCITYSDNIGISAVSENLGGAWEFVKYIISDPSIQEDMANSMFPISKQVFDNGIYDLLNPLHEFEGKEIVLTEDGGFYADGQFYDMSYDNTPMITQKQVDKITALLNSLERNTASDRMILDIVLEEAAAFFAGDRSAEATARLIQSRVAIYVAEKK